MGLAGARRTPASRAGERTPKNSLLSSASPFFLPESVADRGEDRLVVRRIGGEICAVDEGGKSRVGSESREVSAGARISVLAMSRRRGGTKSAPCRWMRSLRHVESGGQYFEITTRAIQSRLLMRPSKRVNETILGIVGRALARFPSLKLFGFIFLSNHYHMLLWAPDQEVLSAFMSYVNGLLARKIGRLHDWRDRFWSRRFEDIVVLDEEALVGRLEYLLDNGVKEGLVASPYEWPGATCVRTLTHGERLVGVWEDASAAYRARQAGQKVPAGAFRSEVEVCLEPIPAWKDLPTSEQRARPRDGANDRDARARAE